MPVILKRVDGPWNEGEVEAVVLTGGKIAIWNSRLPKTVYIPDGDTDTIKRIKNSKHLKIDLTAEVVSEDHPEVRLFSRP